MLMVFITFTISFIVFVFTPLYTEALGTRNPRRPQTEEEFNRLNHHERTDTIQSMRRKLSAIDRRRKRIPWNIKDNPDAKIGLAKLLNSTSSSSHRRTSKPPNVLLMMADEILRCCHLSPRITRCGHVVWDGP